MSKWSRRTSSFFHLFSIQPVHTAKKSRPQMLQQNEEEQLMKFQENSRRKSLVLEHFLQEEHETLLKQYESLWDTHQQMIVQHKHYVEKLKSQIELLKNDNNRIIKQAILDHSETRPDIREQQSQTIYMEQFICSSSQTD